MSILNMFGGGGGEERAAIAADKRMMSFQREQNTTTLTIPEDRTELMNQEGKSDLLKWQQDLDGELMDLVNRLRGYTMGEDGEFKMEVGIEPLCNNKFIVDIVIPQCKPFISRNLINSTFTVEDILMSLKCTANDITANMADGYDLYDIKFQNYDVILRMIKNIIRAGAFRALNGFTKKVDSTVHKLVESRFESDGQQKRIFGSNKS